VRRSTGHDSDSGSKRVDEVNCFTIAIAIARPHITARSIISGAARPKLRPKERRKGTPVSVKDPFLPTVQVQAGYLILWFLMLNAVL